jgi:hypothetical protein
MVMIRPKKDVPSIARMFPRDEVLAIRAYIYNCPEQASGCIAAINEVSWAPVCEARSFERELRASFVPNETVFQNRELRGRPNNLLLSDLLSSLPPVSLETRENLKSWTEYLDWRKRLVAENARAIRYLRAQRNQDGSLSFLVVHDGSASAPSVSWLRCEELEALPLSASGDTWTFLEPETDNGRQKRYTRATLLGEADSVKSVAAATTALPEGCPWDRLDVLEVRFPPPDDDVPDQNLPKGISATGFLRICQRGDTSLIDRMKQTIEEFSKNGSTAAPFLSSYLFDISQARLPARSRPIETFLNPDLNEDQKRAVQLMVDAPDIALVQGPPGTGKTTVIAEAIWQFARKGQTVMLASQSIAAVENALDRLENTPEIRPCLRRKARSDSSAALADDDPFSDAAVLREYYATLGHKAHAFVESLDQTDRRIAFLRKVASELEPMAGRIAEEAQAAASAERNALQLREQVREAESRAEAAEMLRRGREASDRLLSALPTLTSATLGDWARDVPASVVEPLADTVRSAAAAFEAQGIRLWSDMGTDEPHRPSDIRLRALAGAAERLRQLRDTGLPALLQCVAQWRATSGERLVDDESARIVQDLKIQLDEVERRRDEADENGNEDEYQRYDDEARRIRRGIREAKTAAKTSVSAFRDWFTVPRADGRTLADAIEAADGNRATVLDLVSGFESFATELLKRLPDEEREVSDLLRQAVESLPDDEGAEAALRKARRALRDAETLVQEAQERRRMFEKQTLPTLERLRSAESGAPTEPTAALAWCRDTATEIERRMTAERGEHPWLEPVFREWDRLTSNPNAEDQEQILPLYLASCNVIGITCTANRRLLDGMPLRFDVVIIDEVSKATPPELLAPMTCGAKTILVGDHRQLPPLFDEKEPLSMEEIANREEEDENIPEEQKIVRRNFRKYEDMVEASLFKRHFEAADPRLKSSLWVQHRMHPDIMDVINVFYEGRLSCGIPADEVEKVRNHGQSAGRMPWLAPEKHAYWIDSSCAPDGSYFEEEKAGTSRVNRLEVGLIVRTLKSLDSGLDGQTGPDGRPVLKSVGVIAFYGKQKGFLAREIRKLSLHNLKCKVETVDRFQGQESDYVLVSMTRNKRYVKSGKRSFVARFERINVAFSRARELLLIFGAADFFRRQPVELPSLDGTSPSRSIHVYGQIADMLARRGTVIRAGDIIHQREWATLAPAMSAPQPRSKAAPDRGPFPRGTHPPRPRRAFQPQQERERQPRRP